VDTPVEEPSCVGAHNFETKHGSSKKVVARKVPVTRNLSIFTNAGVEGGGEATSGQVCLFLGKRATRGAAEEGGKK